MQWDRQLYDDVALERIEVSEKAVEEPFHDLSTYHAFKLLIEKYRGGRVTNWGHLSKGSFNIVYRMRFQEGGKHAILRIPCPGIVQFPDEKVRNEVAVMRYVAQKTTIPVPHVYYSGVADENPTGLGPFIIMDYVENEEVFSSTLEDPELREKAEQPVLDPDVFEEKLECLYGQMANYVLQLAKLEFPRIGSLVPNGRDTYVVGGRPLTMNMNALILLASIPAAVLPSKDKTYQTADEWYLALADMHVAHLVFQRNDLTRSPDDCRNKYVARQLFRRLAKEGRLTNFGFADDNWSAQSATWRPPPNSGISTQRITRPTLSPAPDAAGPFRLWCDDLRGGNILLDRELRVAAIIDWEFAYVGPPQFALDPPWWLLLSQPEYWPKGLEDWRKVYDQRLQTWLRVMEDCERKADRPVDVGETSKTTGDMDLGREEQGQENQDACGSKNKPIRLSTHMRESWETGRFWLNYAARRSWAFDAIYWRFLDKRFFGDRGEDEDDCRLWRTRVGLLTDAERNAMEPFVEWKMEEGKADTLIDWVPEEAKRRLAEVLF